MEVTSDFGYVEIIKGKRFRYGCWFGHFLNLWGLSYFAYGVLRGGGGLHMIAYFLFVRF
jgi:hypothetical protein